MGPLTRLAYETMQRAGVKEEINNAAHVHVTREMWSRICEIGRGLPPEVCFEGRLPAPSVVIEIEGHSSMLFGKFDGDLPDQVGMMILIETGMESACEQFVGVYTPQTTEVTLDPKFGLVPERDEDANQNQFAAVALMIRADILFSLMAEPRFVLQVPASRTKRKMAAKKLGVPALKHTWVKLGWTIGGTTKAKNDIAGSAPQKAFHMVRAHFRYYDRQTPKAKPSEDPNRPPWKVWVEAYYSGHPALGEIKHHYTPRLDDPGKSSKLIHGVVAEKIAKATRNPAMTAFPIE